nr:MAG TPA: hypothetical protein [Caudoviricetes sp.]
MYVSLPTGVSLNLCTCATFQRNILFLGILTFSVNVMVYLAFTPHKNEFVAYPNTACYI